MSPRKLSFVFIFTLILSSTVTGQALQQLSGENLIVERPTYFDDTGNEFSDLIYVKFNQRVIPDAGKAALPLATFINNENIQLSEAFTRLTQDYGPYASRKVYPMAAWGDTVVINKRTNIAVQVPDFSQVVAFEFAQPVPIAVVTAELETLSNVAYAEGPLKAYTTDVPNDWLYVNGPQWSLQNTNAETAWTYAKGTGTKIAIVDEWVSGISIHPDLSGRLTNDFGYYGGHGTWVAGVAGAITNNSDDMASLGWDIGSMEGYHCCATAIKTAADEGADVINNSWITTVSSQLLEDNVNYALSLGVVVVGSAGNEEYCTECVKYPAAYSFDIGGTRHDVLAVSGTLQNDDFVSGWTYSPGTDPINDPTNAFIDVAAPGDETLNVGDGVWVAYSYSDGSGHTLVKRAGTSMSAPQVSALAALLLSVDPTLTPPDVYTLITGSAEKVGQYTYDGNGWNKYLGYGRINAGDAVCSIADACKLDGPTSLHVANAGSVGQNPQLAWTAPAGVITEYNIYRKFGVSGSWAVIGTSTDTDYTDNNIVISSSKEDIYYYKVAAVDFGATEGNFSNQVSVFGDPAWKIANQNVAESASEIGPTEFGLAQNYPNPFNPSTEIRFAVPEAMHVSLVVYDATGREVARLVNGHVGAGHQVVSFDASNLPSGIYLYRLDAGPYSEIRRMVLLK